jgi:hypothetical protein
MGDLKMKITKIASVLIILIMVVSCGGGSAGTSTTSATPVSVTCTNGSSCLPSNVSIVQPK